MVYLGIFLIAMGSYAAGFFCCQYSAISRLRMRDKYIKGNIPPLYVLEIILGRKPKS